MLKKSTQIVSVHIKNKSKIKKINCGDKNIIKFIIATKNFSR